MTKTFQYQILRSMWVLVFRTLLFYHFWSHCLSLDFWCRCPCATDAQIHYCLMKIELQNNRIGIGLRKPGIWALSHICSESSFFNKILIVKQQNRNLASEACNLDPEPESSCFNKNLQQSNRIGMRLQKPEISALSHIGSQSLFQYKLNSKTIGLG